MADEGQRLRARAFFISVPDPLKAECYLTVANILHTMVAPPKPALTNESTLNERLDAVAAFFPPYGRPNKIEDSRHRESLEDALIVYTPKEDRRLPNPQGHAGAAVAAAVIETADSLEKKEKYVSAFGWRWWRNSEEPYTALYPHHWLLRLARSPNDAKEYTPEDFARVYGSWFQAWKRLTAAASHSDVHNPRIDILLRQMESWFLLLPPTMTIKLNEPEDKAILSLPKLVIRSFFNVIEMLLESYLLTIKTVSAPSIATQKFHVGVTKIWAKGEPLDYWALVVEARDFKGPAAPPTPATGSSFRGGRKP